MLNKNTGVSLTRQLLNNLGVAIVKSDYSLHKKFPSEAELCKAYNISRSATREAVKMLTAKGLLLSRPRQGIRILPMDRWNMFDPDVLGWILQSTPNLKMLKEFSRFRLAIEPEACALAAEHHNDISIQNISAALQRMKAAEAGFDDPLESDIDFHLSILSASENPFFIQLKSFVETALRVSIRYTNRFKGVKMADYHAHEKIYAAIAQGNPEAAHKFCKELQLEAIELISTHTSEE